MINLGAEIFTNPQKLGQLLQDPEEPESQGQKQPILQPTEKVLTGVRGTFKIYGINIPEFEMNVLIMYLPQNTGILPVTGIGVCHTPDKVYICTNTKNNIFRL